MVRARCWEMYRVDWSRIIMLPDLSDEDSRLFRMHAIACAGVGVKEKEEEEKDWEMREIGRMVMFVHGRRCIYGIVSIMDG